jgi:hypothetical protein
MRYILKDREVVACNDPVIWPMYMFMKDHTVAHSVITIEFWGQKFETYEILTVFTGMDNGLASGAPPIVFESRVYGGLLNNHAFHSDDWDLAERNHESLKQKVVSEYRKKYGWWARLRIGAYLWWKNA